ncbi:hypothetical protein [Spirosoma telluris]|uniref:hypothetical protein n=1 Tax=Spirosoma telluris TaxID=2183553 RepID=UPI002FC282C7
METYYKNSGLLLPALTLLWKLVTNLARQLVSRYRQFPLAYTTLVYLFCSMAFSYYPMVDHWLTGFMMMSLPLAIPCGLVACIYLLYKQKKMIATAGLIWVLFSFLVVKRLVGANVGDMTMISQAQTLNVLSFNSETFPTSAQNGFDPSSLDADIACFQEYSPNRQIESQYAAKVEKLSCFDKGRRLGWLCFLNTRL